MNAIELLLQRQSTPMLTSPAPNEKDLDAILAAGMRAPDHGALKPWHFHIIQGQGLQRLSDLYVKAMTADFRLKAISSNTPIDDELLNEKQAKTKKMPFRAPMVIVISTQYSKHSKVPKKEQLITAGCCAHAMQMAAFSLGYGAMWRTGDLAYSDIVKKGLAVEEGNDIVGFLYVGTPTKEANIKPAKDYQEHVTYWS